MWRYCSRSAIWICGFGFLPCASSRPLSPFWHGWTGRSAGSPEAAMRISLNFWKRRTRYEFGRMQEAHRADAARDGGRYGGSVPHPAAGVAVQHDFLAYGQGTCLRHVVDDQVRPEQGYGYGEEGELTWCTL